MPYAIHLELLSVELIGGGPRDVIDESDNLPEFSIVIA